MLPRCNKSRQQFQIKHLRVGNRKHQRCSEKQLQRDEFHLLQLYFSCLFGPNVCRYFGKVIMASLFTLVSHSRENLATFNNFSLVNSKVLHFSWEHFEASSSSSSLVVDLKRIKSSVVPVSIHWGQSGPSGQLRISGLSSEPQGT